MAASASAQQRAELIREMSRDMNKTRNSSGSSRHSQAATSPEPTTSDFDPENEAIMSTRQLDNHSQHLPPLRASAQKYSRFTRPAEPDFAINTSAIGRAFPDFSQGGNSSEEDSISIEIGRGVKSQSRGTMGKLELSQEYSSNAQLSLDGDSMDFSAPMIGNYEVTTTPPLTQRRTPRKKETIARGSMKRESQVRKPSGLQKETFDPSPPPSKTKDYGSGESRKASGESHRTLASMHARVREDNDQSHISEERPPTIDVTARNTRFGNTKIVQPSSQGALPTRFSSAQTLLNSVAPIHKQKLQAAATPNQGTQQSFMLPDLPNISELVSGVFEDGTPVFSRHGKPRASRFVLASQAGRSRGQEYAGVNEIPVPDDEQAIFLSLKLLQDKVFTLEKDNAEAAQTIEELGHKNRVLEGEKDNRRRAHRSDSALGTTDSDGGHDTVGGQRKLQIEKNRLESSTRTLQKEVDASRRKCSTAETILKTITQERDSAVSQLVVAYGTVEQLKRENEDLKEQNSELKASLASLSNGRHDGTQKWTAKEDPYRPKLGTREAVESMKEEPNAQEFRAQQKGGSTTDSTQEFTEKTGQHAKASANKDANTMFDLSSKHDAKSVSARALRQSVQIDYDQNSEDSVYEAPMGKAKDRGPAKLSRRSYDARDDEASRDLTYLSFIDNREIAQLRRTLEHERIERKQRQTRNRGALRPDDTITQTGPVGSKAQSSQQAVPRKSSMKDLTTKSAKENEVTHTSPHLDGQAEHSRRHSETSMSSLRSRRRGLNVENMTSAFIVPDITIHTAGAASHHQLPELTQEARKILDGLANHNNRNCTVCKRAVGVDEQHNHDEAAKEAFKITKPVPVSERMPKATVDEGDPTIRPSQAPGLALATVLNGLEDELAHLKIQLGQYQALYNGHDPALSKRRRKSVQQQIETILQDIDVKADQIYALYDVLEGQKQDGHEISEKEVEVTLQSFGVKAPELKLRGGGEEEVKNANDRHPWDLESDAESGDELPWEGIESTVETTKSGFARAARRRSSGA